MRLFIEDEINGITATERSEERESPLFTQLSAGCVCQKRAPCLLIRWFRLEHLADKTGSTCPLHHPRVAQRDALLAKGASRARSMLALFPGKGSEIALPSGSRRDRKDAFKPDS